MGEGAPAITREQKIKEWLDIYVERARENLKEEIKRYESEADAAADEDADAAGNDASDAAPESRLPLEM